MKGNMASQYDSAAMPAQGGDDFASQYDAAAQGGTSIAPEGETDAAAAPLDIPAEAVGEMQSLKASGDMAALGSYVAQFLQ